MDFLRQPFLCNKQRLFANILCYTLQWLYRMIIALERSFLTVNAKQNIAKQKYLGKTGMIIFITLANMFIPLSTDLYLPVYICQHYQP